MNCITLAVDVESARYYSPELRDTMAGFDTTFVILFTIEALVRFAATGFFTKPHGYFLSGWNVVDFIIVVCGWVSLFAPAWTGVTSIKLLRIVRLLGAVTIFQSFRDVLASVVASLYMLSTVVFLFLVFALVFGVIGVQLFGGLLSHHCMGVPTGCPLPGQDKAECSIMLDHPDQVCTPSYLGTGLRNCTDVYGFTDLAGNAVDCVKTRLFPGNSVTRFEHIGWATVLLFQVMTGSGWVSAMYQTMDGIGYGLPLAYFVLIVIIGMLFVANLVIAVLGNAYISHHLARKEERRLLKRVKLELALWVDADADYSLRRFWSWMMVPGGSEIRTVCRSMPRPPSIPNRRPPTAALLFATPSCRHYLAGVPRGNG